MTAPDPNSPTTVSQREAGTPSPREPNAALGETVDHGPRPAPGETVDHVPATPSAGPAVTAQPPPQIPGYEVLGELGRGGMGVVYQARQKGTNRLVALKMVLAGEHAAPEQLQRFLLEAETVARLSHPDIVQIHEVGSHDGRPFLALEYVPGGSLAERLRGQPWEPRLAAELLERLARAVDHAHRQGIVHRDLKPGNVLLTAAGLPKVTDFGLAKQVEGGSGMTSTGAVLGTPSYMAPEQAGGHSRRAGPATDVYALGAILYELLTGRPPFVAATAVEVLLKVVHEEAPSVTRLMPRLPIDLATICTRCLEREPARRYPSAGDLADDLHRYLNNEPIQARPVGEWERLVKWAKRRPAVAASLLGSALVLVLGTVISVSFAVQATRAERVAVTARNASQRQTAELLFDRGQALCERGEVVRGVHWLLASLRETPPEETAFRRLVLTNLAAWDQQIASLELLMEHPEPAWSLAFSPDSKAVLSACTDGQVRRWDLATGELLNPTLRHPGAAHNVSFSPDGKTVITSSLRDGRQAVYRWDAATGAAAGEPLPHPGTINSVHYTPDGKSIVIGGGDGTIQVWDAATGRPAGAPLRVAHSLRALHTVSSPDGRWLLVGTAGMTKTDPALVELREAADLRKVRFRVPSAGGHYDLAFHPGGKIALTGDLFDAMARRWDVETGKPVGEPLFHPGVFGQGNSVSGVRYTPDGRVLVTCSFHGGLVRFWEGLSGEPLSSLGRTDPTASRGLVLSPDGRFLGVSSDGPTCQAWRLARPSSRPVRLPESSQTFGAAERPRSRNQGGLYGAARVSAEGNTAVLFQGGQTAQLVEVATGRPLGPPLYHPWGPVGAVAFCPRGRLLATSENLPGRVGAVVHLWDVDTGQPHAPPVPQTNWVITLAFSPDGGTLATGDYHGVVRLWDTRTGQPLGQPLEQKDIVLCLAFSPDGHRLIAGVAGDHHHQHGAQVWDLATRQPLGPFLAHKHWVGVVAFSPDGRTVLTGSRDGTVRLWDGATLQPLGDPLPHGNAFTGAVFSPDSKRVATVSADGAVRLWDASTGKPLPRGLLAHPYPVMALAFSPDSGRLIAGCQQGLSRLWDLDTGKALGPPLVQRQDIRAVAFQPDGRSCVTIAADGDTRVWSVPGPPAEADPDLLTLRLQVRTGLEMDAGQSLVPLDAETWHERRHRLQERDGRAAAPLTTPLDDAAWHEARARDAEQDGDDFGALWHLDQLVALRPLDWSLFARRARVHAGAGRLDRAAAEYTRAAALAPAEVLLDWYLDCAATCERREQWSPAQWYLDRVVPERPGDWRLRYERAAVHARLGKKAACEADRAKAVELGTDGNHLSKMAEDEAQDGNWDRAAALHDRARRRGYVPSFLWASQALVCLKGGDLAGYREVCARACQQVRHGVTNRSVAEDCTELCTLGPAGPPDYEPLLGLVRGWVAKLSPAQTGIRHDLLNIWGALEYRAGHYREAVTRLQEGLAAVKGQGEVHDWVFLAMAYHRLGNPAESRKWLARALAQPLPEGNDKLWDRLEIELLRREAQALIQGGTPDPAWCHAEGAVKAPGS